MSSDHTNILYFQKFDPFLLKYCSVAMNADAVSQLVTVLEKTTSPDQVSIPNCEKINSIFPFPDGVEAGPSLP